MKRLKTFLLAMGDVDSDAEYNRFAEQNTILERRESIVQVGAS